MNFAIFCGLLAFCAFNIVHALTKDVQSFDLEDQITDDLYRLVAKKQTEFQVALKGAKHNKNAAACENTFGRQISDFVVNSVTEYQKCSDDGPDMLDLRPALACTGKFFKSASALLDSYVNQGKTCLGIQGKSKHQPEGKSKGKHEGKLVGKHEGKSEGKQEGKLLARHFFQCNPINLDLDQ